MNISGKVAFLSILILMSSCRVEEVELDEIEELKLVEMSKNGIVLNVKAKINNPNSFNIKVTDSDFDIYLNDKFISKGQIENVVKIKKKSNESHFFTLRSEELESTNQLLPILLQAALTGRVKGRAKGFIKGKTFLFVSRKLDVDIEENLAINQSLLNN